MQQREIVIVGGGLMGAALAWALAGLGHDVLVLDGGDLDPRASRANLGLGQRQGAEPAGLRDSVAGRCAALHWPAFAALLQKQTGIDLQLQQPG
ncbi:MAG TPA: FAD-dependent oxidoreductase [Pseudomonas sp.]|uniref:FAD-dependent oxidoreductase n=1 Tax=Pseudomonas sp. TaxID=306 RepID=UPI002ED90000